jgi:hypothetical protein
VIHIKKSEGRELNYDKPSTKECIKLGKSWMDTRKRKLTTKQEE